MLFIPFYKILIVNRYELVAFYQLQNIYDYVLQSN